MLAQVWTHSYIFTFLELFSEFSNVNTLRAQLNFPSKPNFGSLFEFPATKSTQKRYLPHLSSENCEINSIKSELPRAFHKEHPPISMQFSVLILFNFHWKNSSIINSFHTVAPNSCKSSQCTPTHWELSKDVKNATWSVVVWNISA
jgi:hypothetical protein